MVGNQDDNRAEYRDQQTVEVQSGNTGHPERIEEPAADNRPDHTEADVDQEAITRSVDDLAGDEASDEAQDDPGNDCHVRDSLNDALCQQLEWISASPEYCRRCA